jgi:hypothetical protein
MQYVWSLITLVSLVFPFLAVHQWIRLTSLFILIVLWAQKYYILNVFKRSLILAGGNAGSFICRPHVNSTVSDCILKSWTEIIMTNRNFKTEPPTFNTNLVNLRAAALSP